MKLNIKKPSTETKRDKNDIDLLKTALDFITPAVLSKPTVEQSDCVAFVGGIAYAMNSDFLMRCPSGLKKDLSFVIPFGIFKKFVNSIGAGLSIEVENDNVILGSINQKATIRTHAKVSMPYSVVDEAPPTGTPIDKDLLEILKLLTDMGKDEKSPQNLNCVHFGKTNITSVNNGLKQLVRTSPMKGIEGAIHNDVMKIVCGMSPVSASATDNFVHFRNGYGGVISCRKYTEPLPPLKETLFDTAGGKEISFNQEIVSGVENASMFLDSEAKSSPSLRKVRLTLHKNEIEVSITSSLGHFTHRSAFKSPLDEKMSFLIAPDSIIWSHKFEKLTLKNGGLVLKDRFGKYEWTLVVMLSVEETKSE